jgi:hypothetical protein
LVPAVAAAGGCYRLVDNGGQVISDRVQVHRTREPHLIEQYQADAKTL